MRIYCLYSMLLFISCNQNKPQENYDAIIISEFKNNYDIINRLSRVEIAQTQNMYYGPNKSEVFKTTSNGSQQYEYKDSLGYTMKELVESSGESRVVRYANKTIEELRLEGEKDTIWYSFDRYYDKDKPEYSRLVWKNSDEASPKEGYEIYYYYDKKGNCIKKINTDLKTKESKQEIICKVKKTNKDTTVIQTIINDTLQLIEKEFTDGRKKIKQTLDCNMNLINTTTKYDENGLKVEVNKSVSGINCITDSVYIKNDKKVKSTMISSDNNMKITTISQYDKWGNIIKEVVKTKHNLK